MSRALNRGRQTHIEVPSSNEPPTGEWGKPLWYTLRLTALQARENLTEEDAGRLVAFFDSLHILIPCVICRTHYSAYYASSPYTAEMARSIMKSMEWVEDLRMAVDARIKLERQGSVDAHTTIHAAVPVAAPTVAPNNKSARITHRSRPSQSSNATAPQRRYAIQSAVHVAQMNNAGRKIGCNCGVKSRK